MVAIDPEPVAVLGTWVAGKSELIAWLPTATPIYVNTESFGFS